MKKIILLFLLLATILFLGREVHAANDYYYNLIDMNQVAYDSNQKVFYSTQTIDLEKNKDYTFVASSNFFGTATKSNTYALLNKSLGANILNEDNESISLSLKLNVSDLGLYYSTIKPTEKCTLEITDFLTKGYRLDNLPKSQAILFKGKKEKFKGFSEVEYLTNYEKVGDSIDVYTSYTNPIATVDITNRIKTYDNSLGFYGTPTLLSDEYKGTNKLGDYQLIYSSKDNSNNERILTVNVKVVDNVPPVIEGPDVIEWDCYNSFPLPIKILSNYKAYDAVDGDVSDSMVTTASLIFSYIQGETKDYEVTVKATDKSGNTATKKIIIRASDITPPTLTVKDMTFNLSDIGELAFASLFEQVVTEVSDNSQQYTISYEHKETSGNMGFSGIYEVTVVAKDAAGNETKKVAKIKINDDIAPDFYIHTDLFSTTTEEIYSIEQIKSAIVSNLEKEGILYESVELISCDYITNEKNPGNYTVKYAYNYQGKTNYALGTITVEDVSDNETDNTWLWAFAILTPLAAGIFIIKKLRSNSY